MCVKFAQKVLIFLREWFAIGISFAGFCRFYMRFKTIKISMKY